MPSAQDGIVNKFALARITLGKLPQGSCARVLSQVGLRRNAVDTLAGADFQADRSPLSSCAVQAHTESLQN